MSQEISLKEYDFLYFKEHTPHNEKGYFLNEKSFLELEKFVLANEESANYLKLSSKKGFGKILRAQNYVGLIQTKDGTTIEILPKIKNLSHKESKNILLKMLQTLKKSPFKHFNSAQLKSEKMPLLEIFISMFLEELSLLIRKGIRSDYIQKEENLHYLKGKLSLSKQIKYNRVNQERFYVEYEEFTSDRVENRLIKTTLNYLYKKSRLNTNQQKIREFLFVFDSIGVSHSPKNDFKKIQNTREMQSYENVLLYAKTFLVENSFSPYKGSDVAFALLFDMNRLFESYLGVYLKRKGFNVRLQDRGKYLVESHKKFALRPDIVINRGQESEVIADIKYKNILNVKDISQADMYQLYAYGTKYKQTKQLYLIYPKNDTLELERVSYLKNELHLNVLFFDLSLGFEQDIGLTV